MQQIVFVVTGALVFGCSTSGEHIGDDVQSSDFTDNRAIAAGAAVDMILASHGRDTVRIVTFDAERRLLWTRHELNRTREQWRSGDFGYATPWVALTDINGDSLPDLLLSLEYEELIGGAVMLGDFSGFASVAYSAFDGFCRAPEFLDFDGDGRLEIIEYLPGAVSLKSCVLDGPEEACAREFWTGWRSLLSYDERSRSYRVDSTSLSFRMFHEIEASRLDSTASAMRANPGLCSASVSARLDSMATQARRLSR